MTHQTAVSGREAGYAELSERHLRTLESIVGASSLVRPGDDGFEQYGRDETEDLYFAPGCAVRVTSADMIGEILRFAQAEHIAVTPRAAGTGLSGGALPVFGGIVLSLGKMDRILEIDTDNLFTIVQPGVITQVLQEAVEKHGLYYPPDPASRGSCTIGGNIAENAGGPRCVKYGVTKDYVTGLKAVTPTGESVSFGGKLLKNVTGYNMVQTFIGSEGTLGVVTEATLRLIPHPTARRLLLAPFARYEDAAACVAGIFRARITPSVLEFLDHDSIDCASKHLGKTWPASDGCEAQLMIELDGFDEDLLDRQLEAVGAACMEAGADDVVLADSRAREEELWSMRRSMGDAVKSLSTYREEDTCVPRHRLPELVRGVKAICGKFGIRLICYGHAGDGNLHCNLLRGDLAEAYWHNRVPDAITAIFRLAVSLGGTITGEHGVGYVQKRWLPIAQSAAEIALQVAIKKAWDPGLILNPGKIFPDPAPLRSQQID